MSQFAGLSGCHLRSVRDPLDRAGTWTARPDLTRTDVSPGARPDLQIKVTAARADRQPHVAKHPAASSTPVRWRRWTEVTLSRQRSERVPTAVDFDRLSVWPWSHSDSTSHMDGPLDKLADHH
jgi:hypothetical protein